jgi:hypothetical protein
MHYYYNNYNHYYYHHYYYHYSNYYYYHYHYHYYHYYNNYNNYYYSKTTLHSQPPMLTQDRRPIHQHPRHFSDDDERSACGSCNCVISSSKFKSPTCVSPLSLCETNCDTDDDCIRVYGSDFICGYVYSLCGTTNTGCFKLPDSCPGAFNSKRALAKRELGAVMQAERDIVRLRRS